MSGNSNPSQASFPCKHCRKAIFIPAGLPPTTAPCPHCGKEVTSPDQSAPAKPEPIPAGQGEQPVRLESSRKAPQQRAERPAPVREPLQPVQPVETLGGAKQRRGKGNMAAVIAAVAILLVALGVTYWLAQKWKGDGKSAGGGERAAQSGEMSAQAWLATGWKQEASEVLYAFMTATSPEERMRYVIQNPGVMEELEMYYPEGVDDSDTPKEAFGHVMGSELDHKRGIFLMQYRQPAQIDMREYFGPIGSLDRVMGQEPTTLMEMAHRIDEDNLSKPIGINAFFKKTDDGLKLDASVFIQGKRRTFQAFADYPQPGKTKMFRVVARESLSHALRNDKRYRTYRLEDFAYPQDFVNVPVRVDSEVGKILSVLNWRGMNREPVARTVTVELGWSDAKPSQLGIVRVVCWEFLGLGGEIGNTAPEPPVPATESSPAAPEGSE